MLSAGDYWCRIVSGQLTESTKAKSPQISISLQAESEAVGSDWKPLEKMADRSVHWSLTEKAWPYTEKKLRALGFNGDFDNPAFSQTHAQFFMEFESYDGKDRERWDLANWGGGAGPEKAGVDVVRKFNAMWKQSQQAVRPAGKPKTPPATKKEPTVVLSVAGDDPVPF